MFRYTIILIICVLPLGLVAQKKHPHGKVKRKHPRIVCYENGQVTEKGKYKYSVRHFSRPGGKGGCGVGRYWRHGKWIEFYEDGSKKSIKIYYLGEVKKVVKEWDEDGKLITDNSETSEG